MDRRKNYWSEECSFGDYMIATDEYLELLIGRGTNQAELVYLADIQEYDYTPEEAARIIASECFSDLGNPNDL